VIGLVLIFITALIIFGGIKRIAHLTQVFVPIMAILYIIDILNSSEIPAVFKLIFTSIFGMNEAISGTIGAAIM
jgi:AGCS family alanine or glycine:cation symporter